MPQYIEYPVPAGTEEFFLMQCLTIFKDFYIYATVFSESRSANVNATMKPDFDVLTVDEKAAVLKWEKIKVAKIFSMALTKILKTPITIPYTTIQNSFFS